MGNRQAIANGAVFTFISVLWLVADVSGFSKAHQARHRAASAAQTRVQPPVQPGGAAVQTTSTDAAESDDDLVNPMEERKHPPIEPHKRDPDDCSFDYAGTGRKALKVRGRGVGHKYQKVNNGQ